MVGVSAVSFSDSFSELPYNSASHTLSLVNSDGFSFRSTPAPTKVLVSHNYCTSFAYGPTADGRYNYVVVSLSPFTCSYNQSYALNVSSDSVSSGGITYYIRDSGQSSSYPNAVWYVPCYSTRDSGLSAAYDYLDGLENPAPQPLFVAATYNNKPMSISFGPLLTEPIFTDFEVLNASYNLFDSEYTPVITSQDFDNYVGLNLKYKVMPDNGLSSEYVCFESMTYNQSDYSSIRISGDFTFYIQSRYADLLGNVVDNYIYPSESYLTVNGDRVYSQVQSLGNGLFRYSATVNLVDTGNIVSVGVWSSFSDSIIQLGTNLFSVGFYADNDLTITPTAVVVPTPDPNTTLGDIQLDTDSIESGIQSEIRNQNTIIQFLMSLPNTIGDSLSKAFIPDAQVLDDYSSLYGSLLEDKLGFVWQAGTLVLNAVTDLQGYLAGEITPQPLTFPGISFPMNGSTITILQPTQVDLNNDLMAVLKPWLDRMIVFVCTIAFLNTCRDMVISIASGASYMEYLHRKARAEDASD